MPARNLIVALGGISSVMAGWVAVPYTLHAAEGGFDLKKPSHVLLAENKLFAAVRECTIAECARRFALVHVSHRQRLYAQGEPCDRMYCVLRGSVRLAQVADGGSEAITRIVGPNELFGEESVFGDAVFSSTATSLCDGILAVCSAAEMRSLLMRYPMLSINIAQYLRDDQNRMLNRIEHLSHRPVRERLFALLQQLAAQCGDAETQGGKYVVNLRHSEIASLIGTTRETVSLELNKLARAGLVSRRGRKVLIDIATEEAA